MKDLNSLVLLMNLYSNILVISLLLPAFAISRIDLMANSTSFKKFWHKEIPLKYIITV